MTSSRDAVDGRPSMTLSWRRITTHDDHRLLTVSCATDVRFVGRHDLPAIVLVPGFVQNRHAFTVPGRSLVDDLAMRGFAVHVVDLPGRAARHPARRRDRLLEYVEEDIAALVTAIADAHVSTVYVGHSMGGLIGVALPSDAVARLSGIVVIGSPLLPLDRTLRRFSLPVEGAARVLSTLGVPFPGRRVAQGLLRARALFEQRHARVPMRVWSRGSLDDDELSFALMHAFTNDSFGAAADLLTLVRTRGGHMGRVPIGERLSALRAPLLVIGGNDDGLAPVDAVEALYTRAGSRDKRLVIVGDDRPGAGVGHIDLLVGRRAPELVWPLLAEFLSRHVQTPVAATMGEPLGRRR
jgi:alpha-beta hydrolase superfamily lysophospholipase